jgi:two-component system sensor histidine kinase RegB
MNARPLPENAACATKNAGLKTTDGGSMGREATASGVDVPGPSGRRRTDGARERDGWTPLPDGAERLRRLVAMRYMAALGQGLAILFAAGVLDMPIPVGPMAAVIVAMLAFNIATWRRLRSTAAVTDREVTLQLLADVGALTIQLGLSGGAANPFAGMYLLPLTIAATWLPWSRVWRLVAVTLACYSAIAVFHYPLALGEAGPPSPLLVAGMWINFAVVACVIAFFVARITSSLQGRERALDLMRERDIVNEHLVRVGTLAAGAAHELNSPMAAMAMVLQDLDERCSTCPRDPELHRHLRALREQLDSCRQTLSTLLTEGERTFAGDGSRAPLDRFLDQVVEAFKRRRPDARIAASIDTAGPAPSVPSDMAFAQGIANLLANAADVSPDAVELRTSWTQDEIRIVIRDRGPGIPPEVEEKLGMLFFSTKGPGKGSGLGVCLASLAVARLGGSLRIGNAQGGGAVAEIVLPAATMPALDIDFAERT